MNSVGRPLVKTLFFFTAIATFRRIADRFLLPSGRSIHPYVLRDAADALCSVGTSLPDRTSGIRAFSRAAGSVAWNRSVFGSSGQCGPCARGHSGRTGPCRGDAGGADRGCKEWQVQAVLLTAARILTFAADLLRANPILLHTRVGLRLRIKVVSLHPARRGPRRSPKP